MSGDKIYMDYSSSLGPIDPQVLTDPHGTGRIQYVPALGYLDMVERFYQKSINKTISPAEFALLRDIDIALLRRYEQARDLSIELLEKWLVQYKFKNWTTHRTNPDKRGKPVTEDEKRDRAKEIASRLGDNKFWHSHGRSIGIEKLTEVLRLEIENYSGDNELTNKIRFYSSTMRDYMTTKNTTFGIHYS